ncbi:MAG: hypothetical protein HOV79_27615 [Hamadaea sp.]|nr:hypothetical protein [Hamadaea sp.]
MTTATATQPVRVEAFTANVKKLGDWTAANRFEVRARNGYALLDLRSPRIEGDIEVRVQAGRSTIKLLVPEDAVVDQWDLTFHGRGTVKDWERPKDATGRRIRLVGDIENGEVRIARGGIAILTAMFSKEFVEDCKRAHREGGRPTVHDPADTHA